MIHSDVSSTHSSLIDEDGVERSRTVVLREQAASFGMTAEDLDVFLQACQRRSDDALKQPV